MFSHEGIWDAIEALARRHGLSASGLAKLAGLDPTTFNKSKRRAADGRPRWPSTESIFKVLSATGTDIGTFFGLDELQRALQPAPIAGTNSVPLLGFAEAGAGGYFDDSGFPAGQGWDEISLPASVDETVYALEVSGQSMMPLYRDGDIVIVSPGASVRRGDRVVARTREGEVMVKILQRKTARTIELASLNPEFPDRQFAASDIVWLARILWASQ